MAVAPDERRQCCPVGASALDSESDDFPESAGPFKELFEARSVSGDGEVCEDSPDRVHHCSNMDVFAGIDADSNVS